MRHTGSVWPSGPLLARAMTRSLRAAKGPKRLLEIGPGTGPFTKVALRSLRPGDEFVIVELNRAFCEDLERRILAPFRRMHPEIVVTLHNAPIEQAPLESGFDFIVCGLPFNNFPPSLVRSIFRRMLALLKPDGELVYFEYAGVRMLKAPLVGSRGREALKRIASFSRALTKRHHGKRQLVLSNFPPALAVRLKAGAAQR
ncbi:MAG TPA: methyltransferase domain-containing protein [Phycisphaerales bacterium]|nr:methyltransferase domain-containing protein [Phycisphaerales bacterium]